MAKDMVPKDMADLRARLQLGLRKGTAGRPNDIVGSMEKFETIYYQVVGEDDDQQHPLNTDSEFEEMKIKYEQGLVSGFLVGKLVDQDFANNIKKAIDTNRGSGSSNV